MSDQNSQWMDNPQLAGLDKEKLKMLQGLADHVLPVNCAYTVKFV